MANTESPAPPTGGVPDLLRAMEVDLRLVGMIGALLVIWIVLDIATGGRFLTPRNLFNLSVQTASVAVMATGMVFVIVARHIDLSVGSMLGVIAMVMGVFQTEIMPELVGFNHPMTWGLTILLGLVLGAVMGGLQGAVIGYLGVPAYIVTLGGLLIWRVLLVGPQGSDHRPAGRDFVMLGGGVAERWAPR